MFSFILRRLLLAGPTLLLAAILVFLLMRIVPGDPALMFVGDVENQEAIDAMRQELGLDQSWPVQFGIWISHIVQGDLGTSIKSGDRKSVV